MLDTPKRCSNKYCNFSPEYKISYPNGKIIFVCFRHLEPYQFERDNDNCKIESLIFKESWITEIEESSEIISWLNRFIEEKKLDDKIIEFFDDNNTHHLMPIKVITEMFEGLDLVHQRAIKEKLVLIDCHNGNVTHFFGYIWKCLIKSIQEGE